MKLDGCCYALLVDAAQKSPCLLIVSYTTCDCDVGCRTSQMIKNILENNYRSLPVVRKLKRIATKLKGNVEQQFNIFPFVLPCKR